MYQRPCRTKHLVLLSLLLLAETQGFQAPWSVGSATLASRPLVKSGVCNKDKLMLVKFAARTGATSAVYMSLSQMPLASAESFAGADKQDKTHSRQNAFQNVTRNRGMSKGEVNAEHLDKAFTAFADTLLQKKGRVRFYRINEAFRREFPQWASEEILSNQTLGRRVQIWYENKFNEPLGKTSRGAYVGLTMLNPQYVSINMAKIRAVQATLNPASAKILKSLGIEVVDQEEGAIERINQKLGSPTRDTPRARARKGKKTTAAPVGEAGGIDRVNQRLGSMKPEELYARAQAESNQRLGSMGRQTGSMFGRMGSVGGRMGSGGGKQRYAGSDTKNDKLEPTLVLCIEAFANSLLVPVGHITFKQLYGAFEAQFPQLADEKHMSPNFLGAHLRDWYEAKYRQNLVRARMPGEDKAEKEGEKKAVRRSALPYEGLSLITDMSKVDLTLLNEAKVALRRALKMEGVGIMVRRSKAGKFVVASIMPGSPASLGGQVEADDVILAVGGLETEGMTPQQLADAVLGPRGSQVSVTLRRSAVGGQSGQVKSGTEGESQVQALDRVYTVQLVCESKCV